MPRVSAWRGTWQPNKRPYVTLTPDVYIALQGETSVIACPDCRREVNFNDYVTGVSTEASVDSPPGSATINLSIPDNDVNDFYSDGQFIIIPMMEIEVYAKGYFLVGGFPQYYRIFWGLVSSVTKDWSGGSTTISISCRDILRWWELTNTTINPAFTESAGSSAGSYQLWQNQYAGMNPYSVIINLAREAMGDFSLNTNSFTSYLPEKGPESGVIGSYAKDVMTYWQLKFSNIWNSLVMYGASGQAYSFTHGGGTISPIALQEQIFANEEKLKSQNQQTNLIKVNPAEIFIAKKEVVKAGSVELFQNEIQTKLSVALLSRDQSGFEFYCDPNGDIVFKPPFYNLNVIPNKPVSWVQDFEIIDDSITDTEQEVYTHITSSGTAFGGVGFDAGISDEITTPRTGVYDFHLLRRYGFRRLDYPTEWASDPKKLFFHLMDWLDRNNAKRQNGTVTIPMRPELRMGFPVWIPHYDSFFYIQGISHQFSVGGQATTTLQLIAKRSKFIAPSNIGSITQTGVGSVTIPNPNNTPGLPATVQVTQPSYTIQFPDKTGANPNMTDTQSNQVTQGKPVIIRSQKTGQLLGYPNVVMVFRSALNADNITKLLQSTGNSDGYNLNTKHQSKSNNVQGQAFNYNFTQQNLLQLFQGGQKAQLVDRLRAHRYEAGSTNVGSYDYAHDVSSVFQDLAMIPMTFITPSQTSSTPILQSINTALKSSAPPVNANTSSTLQASIAAQQQTAVNNVNAAQTALLNANNQVTTLQKQLATANSSKTQPPASSSATDTISAQLTIAKQQVAVAITNLTAAQLVLQQLKAGVGTVTNLPALNMIVRPVSDEFGFEVIGHYKYGRGAFIDRGGVKVSGTAPGSQVNQINTQFASTGGILSDASTVQTGSGEVINFAAQFDQMQPDDFITGASFRGTQGPGSTVDQVQFTNSTTYTNQMQANVGRSVFIEADSLRQATTLGELKPTISLQDLDSTADNCTCGLSRADWLTILPQTFIQQVLNGGAQPVPVSSLAPGNANLILGATAGDIAQVPNPTTPSTTTVVPPTSGALLGSVNPADFFTTLSDYLADKFTRDYQSNAQRELQDTGQSQTATGNNFSTVPATVQQQGVPNPAFNPDYQDNILGSPQNPLFTQASQGDPAALTALQAQANFNFGMTTKTSQNLASAYDNGLESVNQSLRNFGGPGGTVVSVSESSQANPVQPVAPPPTTPTSNIPQTPQAAQVQPVIVQPVPNFRAMILNPSQNSLLSAQLNASLTPPAGSTAGTLTVPPPTSVGQS